MIQKLKIKVNPQTFNKSKYGSITGEIFFEIGSEVFPENNWSDFIIVVLSSWLKAIKHFSETKSTGFEMIFMDGPLAINVTRKKHKELELKFSEKYTDGQEILMATSCLDENLSNELLTTAKKVLKEVEKRNWETPDITALKNIVSSYFS